MSAIRLFLRGGAVIFTALIVLLGGSMAASGAFRPTRFFVTTNLDYSSSTLNIVFETGEIYPITRPGEIVITTAFGLDSFVWWSGDSKFFHWHNGRRQLIGTAISGQNNVTMQWSSDDQIAWVEHQPQHAELKDIAVWNGIETIHLARNAEDITVPTWVGDNRLWWLERPTVADGWHIMQWDSQNATVILEDVPRTNPEEVRFVECGAFWFTPNTPEAPLELWNGKTIFIPQDGRDLTTNIFSWDCQTFLLFKTFGEFIWDGTQLYSFPFERIPSLNNTGTFFGVEPAFDDRDWKLVRWWQGEILQSVDIPQEAIVRNAIFRVYMLNAQTLLIGVSSPDGIGDIYRWDLEANQIQSITGSYQTRTAFPDPSFQIVDTGEDLRLAWCGRSSEDSFNSIYLWEAQTNSITPIQTNAICNLRMMSDGSLLGLTKLEQDLPPVFFLWDGSTSQLFSHSYLLWDWTYEYSDWITWG